MKNVYVCYGNHDGLIGVYTNKKLAYERAVIYTETPNMTYSQLCKEMKDWDKCGVIIDGGDGVTCNIIKEILNN